MIFLKTIKMSKLPKMKIQKLHRAKQLSLKVGEEGSQKIKIECLLMSNGIISNCSWLTISSRRGL